ncbi:hypothetical protein VTI28DRAFT_8702 [Corynascus sepedonium]
MHRGGQVIARDALGEASHSTGTEDTEKAGEFSLLHHPDGDAFSVENLGCKDGLVGMADGVTKIEQIAEAALTLVCRNHLGLDTGRTKHDTLEDVTDGSETGRGTRALGADSLEDGGCVLFEGGEFGLVPDGCGFDYFGHAVDELTNRESLEEGEVDIDALGLPEGADQVLAHGHVDGRLAANGRVNHSEKRRGDLNEADTAHECGGDIANHVTNDAAA